jgi:hypothetical protein
MLTLLCVLVATVPFAVVFGLLEWTNRRARRRREIQARQIALTDGVHERLGAAVAPVVSHRRGGWQVWIAVPFERPALIEALLASVLEVFAPRDGRSLKIVLTRQAEPQATKRGGRDVRLESLPWT